MKGLQLPVLSNIISDADMAYAIIFLFLLTALLSIVEKYLGRYKWIPYVLIGLTLILLAGFREIGIDPDSENYADTYRNYYNTDKLTTSVEYSFIIISAFLNLFTEDAHAIFLFYALVGLSLKFFAFSHFSENSLFLSVLLYIAFYYELHEVTQIRTGILSGFFLLSLKPIAEGKRWIALILIAVGAFFHVSGVVLLPLVFLNNNPLSYKRRLLWAALIPAGYFLYFFGMGVLMTMESSIPYIGEKLALYQKGAEMIVTEVNVNIFSPLQFFMMLLYAYLLFFYDTLTEENKYFPLMMKIFTIGIFCLPAFAALPVLAERLNNLFNIVYIILFANIYRTINPHFFGKLLVISIALILLNYGLTYIDKFIFLWEV